MKTFVDSHFWSIVVTSLCSRSSEKSMGNNQPASCSKLFLFRIDEKPQQHHLLRNDGGLLSPLQPGMRECNKTTLHLQKTGSRCRVVFLRSLIPGWKGKRRLPSFRSRWRCWVYSSLPSFCPFIGPSLLQMGVFFAENILPLVSDPFLGFLNQLSNRKQDRLSLAMWQFLLFLIQSP